MAAHAGRGFAGATVGVAGGSNGGNAENADRMESEILGRSDIGNGRSQLRRRVVYGKGLSGNAEIGKDVDWERRWRRVFRTTMGISRCSGVSASHGPRRGVELREEKGNGAVKSDVGNDEAKRAGEPLAALGASSVS